MMNPRKITLLLLLGVAQPIWALGAARAGVVFVLDPERDAAPDRTDGARATAPLRPAVNIDAAALVADDRGEAPPGGMRTIPVVDPAEGSPRVGFSGFLETTTGPDAAGPPGGSRDDFYLAPSVITPTIITPTITAPTIITPTMIAPAMIAPPARGRPTTAQSALIHAASDAPAADSPGGAGDSTDGPSGGNYEIDEGGRDRISTYYFNPATRAAALALLIVTLTYFWRKYDSDKQ
jgi:hypothetical protein